MSYRFSVFQKHCQFKGREKILAFRHQRLSSVTAVKKKQGHWASTGLMYKDATGIYNWLDQPYLVPVCNVLIPHYFLCRHSWLKAVSGDQPNNCNHPRIFQSYLMFINTFLQCASKIFHTSDIIVDVYIICKYLLITIVQWNKFNFWTLSLSFLSFFCFFNLHQFSHNLNFWYSGKYCQTLYDWSENTQARRWFIVSVMLHYIHA